MADAVDLRRVAAGDDGGNSAVDVQGSGVGEGVQLEPVPLGGEWWEPKVEAAGDGDGDVAPPYLGLPFLLCHSVPLFLLREQPTS